MIPSILYILSYSMKKSPNCSTKFHLSQNPALLPMSLQDLLTYLPAFSGANILKLEREGSEEREDAKIPITFLFRWKIHFRQFEEKNQDLYYPSNVSIFLHLSLIVHHLIYLWFPLSLNCFLLLFLLFLSSLRIWSRHDIYLNPFFKNVQTLLWLTFVCFLFLFFTTSISAQGLVLVLFWGNHSWENLWSCIEYQD